MRQKIPKFGQGHRQKKKRSFDIVLTSPKFWGLKNQEITGRNILQNRWLIDRNIFYRNLTRDSPEHLKTTAKEGRERHNNKKKGFMTFVWAKIFNLTFLKGTNTQNQQKNSISCTIILWESRFDSRDIQIKAKTIWRVCKESKLKFVFWNEKRIMSYTAGLLLNINSGHLLSPHHSKWFLSSTRFFLFIFSSSFSDCFPQQWGLSVVGRTSRRIKFQFLPFFILAFAKNLNRRYMQILI